MTAQGCVFCQIVAGQAPGHVMHRWPGAIAIVPRHPVTPGHLLVLPRPHVADAAADPMLTGLVAGYAASLAQTAAGDFNLIVNCGPAASMTVPHLHWHLVPRREGDGLTLPWTGQVKT